MGEKPFPLKDQELTMLIAERANRLAQEHELRPGRELELWREAEAQVKREHGLYPAEVTGRR
jgi:hypothetical protein